MKSPINFCLALVAVGKRDEQPNKRGNWIYRTYASTDRYTIDFAADFAAEGWEQFDTNQDAHYFGVWVNRSWRLVLTYAEGDWSLVDCLTDAAYFAEIRSVIDFYGEGFIAKTIDFPERPGDPAVVTEHRQDREKFLAGAT